MSPSCSSCGSRGDEKIEYRWHGGPFTVAASLLACRCRVAVFVKARLKTHPNTNSSNCRRQRTAFETHCSRSASAAGTTRYAPNQPFAGYSRRTFGNRERNAMRSSPLSATSGPA